MRTPAIALLALLSLVPLGCGGEPRGAAPPRAFGHAARGGSVVIDRTQKVAYAADADNHAVYRVDLLTYEVVESQIDGAPEQIAVIGRDRIAVTLRDRDAVGIFAVDQDGTAEEVDRAAVPADPFGVALSPQGDLLVTSAIAHRVTALDVDTLAVRWSVDVAREPRAIVVSPDGGRAFVTHVVGDSVSILDLDGEAPTPRKIRALGGLYRNRVDQSIGAGTLHPTAALGYAAVLSESGAKLFVPHVIEQNGATTTRSVPGAYGGVPVEEETSLASVAVLTTKDERVLGDVTAEGAPALALDKAAFIAHDPSLGFAVAPRAAPSRQARAAAIAKDRLLIASQGTNELIELDARSIDPAMSVKKRYPVGEGPTGVDVDPETMTAVVWSQFSHEISIVSLLSGAVEKAMVARDPLPEAVAAGRRLFYTELDRRITRDGRACAGCHPDGRDDGVVWKLGAGPRQTPTLVGRLGRGPFGWLGKHATLEGNMAETITRLGGSGLPDEDMVKLKAFLQEGLIPPSRGRGPALDSALLARGRELFTSESVGCSGCHRLDTEVSDRAVHNVGSKGKSDTTDGFRTPPLLYIGATAPYFHDGRYATLEQLLNDNLDRMGQTTNLSPEDIKALAAFLRTL